MTTPGAKYSSTLADARRRGFTAELNRDGMPQEPEVAHPFSRGASTSLLTGRVSSAEKAHAKSLRNAGKEVRSASLLFL